MILGLPGTSRAPEPNEAQLLHPLTEKHTMQFIITITSIILFTATGASLAYTLNLPVQTGLAAGLALGVMPPLMNLLPGKAAAIRGTEWLNLFLLAGISAVVSYRILIPLLNTEEIVNVTKYLPLLLSTVALYVYYLLLNRASAIAGNPNLIRRLSLLFSGPPMVTAFVTSVTVSTYLLLTMHYLRLNHPAWEFYADKFLDRGIIPPITVLLFSWGLLMLANKYWILARERRLLNSERKFDRSALMQAYYQNLKERGNASPQTYFDLVWKKSAEFYIVPRYINWAIPILGFIGTVLGISLAAEGIQRIIGKHQGLTQLSSDLGQAITPLGIAFDTTLIALSLSVVLTLTQTLLQRWEDNLLIDYENRIRRLPLSSL